MRCDQEGVAQRGYGCELHRHSTEPAYKSARLWRSQLYGHKHRLGAGVVLCGPPGPRPRGIAIGKRRLTPVFVIDIYQFGMPHNWRDECRCRSWVRLRSACGYLVVAVLCLVSASWLFTRVHAANRPAPSPNRFLPIERRLLRCTPAHSNRLA